MPRHTPKETSASISHSIVSGTTTVGDQSPAKIAYPASSIKRVTYGTAWRRWPPMPKRQTLKSSCRRKFSGVLDFGVPLTHLDTHMGALVSRPDLVEAYVNVGVQFNLPVFFLRNLGNEVPDERVRARGEQLIAKLEKHKLPVLDYMTQLYTDGSFDEKRVQYLNAIAKSKPGIHYLILHCGYDDDELRAITASSKRRDTDRRIATDAEFIRKVKQTGVEIVTWKQVRDMNDKRAAEK